MHSKEKVANRYFWSAAQANIKVLVQLFLPKPTEVVMWFRCQLANFDQNNTQKLMNFMYRHTAVCSAESMKILCMHMSEYIPFRYKYFSPQGGASYRRR